jgi:hypothetical protein
LASACLLPPDPADLFEMTRRIPMSTRPGTAPKSKLVERLKEISRGSPAPIGFGRVAETTLPAMLIVAVIPRNEVALVEAAVRAGADAVALRIHGAATDLLASTGDLAGEEAAIAGALAAASSSAMIGVIIGSAGPVTPAEIDRLAGLGVDFIAAYPHLTPANFLELSDVGRLAVLDQTGGQLARGINDLSIHSAFVRTPRPIDSPREMTVLDVALTRAAADAIHRPIISLPSWDLRPPDLNVLRDAGIEAVALVGPRPDAEAAAVEEMVRVFHDAVARLGKPRGRRVALSEVPVVLPRVASSADASEEEEDEEDDE